MKKGNNYFSTKTMVKSGEPKPDGDQNKDKNTLDIGLLEEDDEFEEFPVEGNWVVGK